MANAKVLSTFVERRVGSSPTKRTNLKEGSMEFIEGYFNLINNHVKNGMIDQSFFNRIIHLLEKSLNSEREFSENQFSMYEKKYNENRKKCNESEYGIVRFYRKSMKSYRQRLKEIENYFERLEKVKQSIAT